jgi:hypothetical protein
VKAGKPVILVGATKAEERFLKGLDRRLVAAVKTPHQAVDLILKRHVTIEASAREGVGSCGNV